MVALAALGGATAGPAAGLPDQASPTGEEHAHSHGPDGVDLDGRGRGKPGVVAAPPYAVDAHAPWSSGQWTGGTQTSDVADANALPQFHAIYMYPSNGTSRFSQFAAMIQADARQASDRLNALGKAVRWDTRNGGTLIDITVVRSSNTAKRLGSASQFTLVKNEIASRGLNKTNKKYIVWLDAASQYCGQGELYQDTRRTAANNNELKTTAIVYRPYPTNDPATGGFCRGRTAMHEMGHNLGAVQGVAPHAFDGAHCNDSAEDVMCYTSATSFDSGGAAFDFGNDDYWDPSASKLGWWTVNLSKYLCPSPTTCASPANPAY
ncbi:MAG: hypothetical protein QOG87_2998 [Actinomycetota bacterium]|jgi:hypothetical protein